MKRTLCIAILLCTSTVSFAQGYDFKGLAIGAPVTALKERFPEFYCSKTAADSILGDTNCSLSPEVKCLLEQAPYPDNRTCREAVTKAMTYAGEQAYVSLYFDNDKFGLARITFGPESFTAVVGAMQDKYGPPNTTKTESVTNRMGATFQNKILVWSKAGTTIHAEKYTSRIDQSSVKIYDDTYLEGVGLRKAKSAQHGSKDI